MATRRQRAKRGSLRTRLIALLSQSSGMRAREVFERLNGEQFHVGGKASLRERVSHELSRLHRLGVLNKNGSGGYILASRPAPANQGGEHVKHGQSATHLEEHAFA